MHSIPAAVITALVLSATALAALIDARGGTIPNRLTLPLLAAAPLAHGLLDGPGALLSSLLGLLACGSIPLLLFTLQGMGGGDVKLLAALGAMAGPATGMQLQCAGFLVAGAFAVVHLIARGGLLAGLGRSLRLLVGRGPKGSLEQAEQEGLCLRFGPPLFVASLFVRTMDHLP